MLLTHLNSVAKLWNFSRNALVFDEGAVVTHTVQNQVVQTEASQQKARFKVMVMVRRRRRERIHLQKAPRSS